MVRKQRSIDHKCTFRNMRLIIIHSDDHFLHVPDVLLFAILVGGKRTKENNVESKKKTTRMKRVKSKNHTGTERLLGFPPSKTEKRCRARNDERVRKSCQVMEETTFMVEKWRGKEQY